jgi:hypothetical protein
VTRRLCSAVVVSFGVLAGGCRELPTPAGGVLGVSRVLLPSPGLVVGDTMRDSLGSAAELRVVAFDQNGDTVTPQPATVFLVLDTTAVLDGAFLLGRATGPARVVAQVAGLQTQTETVLVTLRPDTIVGADSVRHLRRVNLLSGDSSYASAELTTIVRNGTGISVTGVDAVVVTYTLAEIPAGSGSGPAVVFTGAGTAPVRDTTAGGGRAARSVRLRIPAVPQLPDSAVVVATAAYRGRSLGAVRFKIVFQTQ